MDIENLIFERDSALTFEEKALAVYRYQKEHCRVYKEYIDLLHLKEPTSIQEIPFLPIEFFKTRKILSSPSYAKIFKSSGTGGTRSSHYVNNLEIYERIFQEIYQDQIGSPEDQIILALLPNYLEQGESSLVYMVDKLIQRTKNELSGFVLNATSDIEKVYDSAQKEGKKLVVFGVTYALLDLAEKCPNIENAIVIETGGMKGRRKEISKAELHSKLRVGLHTKQIYSEYGMTELLSQSYSTENQRFTENNYLNVFIRHVNDPLSLEKEGKIGGVNIIDLGNIHSCSFIATQDLGRKSGRHFEILGRFDNSDIRGCNLLVNK